MSQFTTQEDFTQYMNPYATGRKLPFLRRNIAKAISRGSYKRRRYTTGGHTDQRQLTAVVRRHRFANPYQIQPSSGRTVSFWRKVEINIALNQSTGFNGSNNINWGFGLKGVYGYRGGSLFWLPSVPGFSEWQALFDYYKINAVKMNVFFCKNTSDQSGGSTIGMPILLIANDFDDLAEPMTLDLMNQRVGCRHVQFAADQPNGIAHYVKPKPSYIVQQTADDGTLTTANAGIPFGTTWLDCAQSNIVHAGIKILYDNQGLTTATALGNVTFVFDIEFCFKGYR